MSIAYFKNLSEEETRRLLDAPAYITVLIAGADRRINKNEIGFGKRMVEYKGFTAPPELIAYYESAREDFEEIVDNLVGLWNGEETEQEYSDYLAGLKPMLNKLDPSIADKLLESWRDLASHVAKASGGILGLGSTTAGERRFLDLPMLR